MNRRQTLFGFLVLAQAAHSVEECVGRLWESFPPARFLVALVSTDHALGFVTLNIGFVAFGWWCYFWPVRREWPSAASVAWLWVVVETINGIVHPAWSLAQRAYSPGVATAPLLLVLALMLGRELRRPSAARQGTT
ncbi:MAG: HXXEE domain-containing protein [Vicinamibacterales bacterium]